MDNKPILLILLFGTLLLCNPTWPAVDTTVLPVSSTVPVSVIVSATNMDFGSTAVDASGLSAISMVTITAPQGLVYELTLDGGRYCNACGGSRQMVRVGGEEHVFYQLFQDSANIRQWGDAGFSGSYPAGNPAGPFVGNAMPQRYPVYGLAGTTPAQHAGEYQDTVTVTVHY